MGGRSVSSTPERDENGVKIRSATDMLKELEELMSKKTVAEEKPDAAEEGAEVDRRTAANEAAAEARRTIDKIDPVSLEAELRNELHGALRHLDNCVELLQIMSMRQISSYMRSQQGIEEAESGNRFSPELCTHEKSRSFSLYWRRITKLFRQGGRYVPYTKRVPIRKTSEGDDIGYSMLAFRSVKSEELREYIRDTEQRFRDIRKAMRSIVLARIKIGVADSAVTNFFDATVVGRDAERVRSSALNDWTLPEEEGKLRFIKLQNPQAPDDAQKKTEQTDN